jgi:hypothetical protein
MWRKIMEDDYKEKRSSALRKTVFIALAVFSLWIVATAPNMINAGITLAVIWVVGYFIYRSRRFLLDFTRSEKPLKNYLQERKEARPVPPVPQAPYRVMDSKDVTLDADNVPPLSDREEDDWKNIISAYKLNNEK